MQLRKDAIRDSCPECRMRLPRQRTVGALHERARLRCPAFKATTLGRVRKICCIGHGTCLLMLLISVALYFPRVSSAHSRCLSSACVVRFSSLSRHVRVFCARQDLVPRTCLPVSPASDVRPPPPPGMTCRRATWFQQLGSSEKGALFIHQPAFCWGT